MRSPAWLGIREPDSWQKWKVCWQGYDHGAQKGALAKPVHRVLPGKTGSRPWGQVAHQFAAGFARWGIGLSRNMSTSTISSYGQRPGQGQRQDED